MNQADTKNKLLNSWVKSYYDDLYRWAKFKISDPHLAEDLVQEVFFVAADNFEKFKNESSPKTWLFKILNNKLVDLYRGKTKSKTYSLEEEKVIEITDSFFDKNSNWHPNNQYMLWNSNMEIQMDLEQNLTHCMHSLPDLWKKLIFQKFYENLNAENICTNNAITKTNYWQIMHRTKLFLKGCVEKKMIKIHH
jgi:RNA polymerase sigma-70 factor (ECF subfamily)